jgi:hypothetical protein
MGCASRCTITGDFKTMEVSMLNQNHETEVAVFRDGLSHRVLCPYCATLHSHGDGTASRAPHCRYPEHLPSKQRVNSYVLHPVTFPLPSDAVEIDKEARRIYEILAYRSERPRDRRHPKDTVYHAELEKLRARARSINNTYLLKQYFIYETFQPLGVRQAR